MLTRILKYRPIQFTLTTLIIVGALVCIFTPNYLLFKQGANFANQIMIGYLLMSMFFLVLNQSRLMLTSIICCAGLCIFLKNASADQFRIPAQTSEEVLQTVHLNLSASEQNHQLTIDAIIRSDADLVSLQEVTPDWAVVLEEGLKDQYPHHEMIVRMDPYGSAIFSKYKIKSLDTFNFEHIPNIVGCVRPEGFMEDVYFISSHTTAPLYSGALNKMRAHLKQITTYVQSIPGPVITMGDYNAPPWWTEIQDLKYEGRLHDSRTSAANGIGALFENPIDYILHTDQLKCVGFENIETSSYQHLGIKGTYQYKPESFDAQTATQEL